MPKMTKIERAFRMYEKNMAKYGKGRVNQIAEKLGIDPKTVRGYVYRMRHPDRYKAAVQRYVQRKADKKAAAAKAKEAKKAKRAERKARKTQKEK